MSWAVRIGPHSAYRVWAMTAGAGERRPRTVASIPARLPCYMHSFGLTDRFAVLIEQPLVLDPRRMLLSGRPFIDNYEWRPGRGCAFLLVDRHAGRLVARVQAPPFFVFHVVNAWEEGEEVVVDLCAYDDAEIVGSMLLDALRGDGARVPGAELRRWRVPVRDGATAIGGRPLAQPNLELPRIDYARRNSRPYRVTWGVSAGGSGPGDRARAHLGDRLVRIDVEDGTVLAWGEDGCFPGEPVPVREPGADAEDAGVVLSVVLDARAGTSFLLVLDAATMAERARATVPHHIPYGFHGAFV